MRERQERGGRSNSSSSVQGEGSLQLGFKIDLIHDVITGVVRHHRPSEGQNQQRVNA